MEREEVKARSFSIPQGEPHRSFFTSRVRLAVVGALLLVALLYFVFTVSRDWSAANRSVSEALAASKVAPGQFLRLRGKLVPGSFRREEGSPVARFTLTDGKGQVEAVYQGALPDLFFNPEAEIWLEGSFGKDGLFHAERVLIKCPTKYRSASGGPAGNT